MIFSLPKELIDKFSSKAIEATSFAVKLSKDNNHKNILPIHILAGIYNTKGSIGSNILKAFGFSSQNLALEIKKNIQKNNSLKWKPIFHPLSKSAFKKATLAAQKANSNFVGTEHLLFAIVSQKEDTQLIKFFQKIEFPLIMMQEQLLAITTQTPNIKDLSKAFEVLTQQNSPFNQFGPSFSSESKSAIDSFSQDITDLAKKNKLEPVINRQEEIDRMVTILSRKMKNNPILVGEAGVGKTAIIEGLAQRIVNNKVPFSLKRKKIISLNMANLLASTTFRGDFEARLKTLLEEIENDPNVIIFIDEIHTIVGAGGSSFNTMDAANILKPVLTKENFKVIGATTPKEYLKYIEKDPALKRRFQKIEVKEPTETEVTQILDGISPSYEAFYNVYYSRDFSRKIVEITKKYIHEGFFPDKAINLLDEICANKIKNVKEPNSLKKIEELNLDLQKTLVKKEININTEKFETAKNLKTLEKKIKEDITKLNKQLKEEIKKNKIKLEEKDIYNAVSQLTSIPIKDLVSSNKERFEALEKNLTNEIIGQDEIIKNLIDTLKRYQLQINDVKKPIGSFLFMGPSGVGKTETAKMIAKYYFNKNPIDDLEENLIKIDMSEFSERHQISRLIGAPAGYVGFEEGGQLIEQIKHNPYTVVLFDEIEKANKDAINILLQILEDGTLTSAQGEKVYFNNALIILTSNIGTSQFTKEAAIGFKTEKEEEDLNLESKFEEIKTNSLEELKTILKPEFINRIDNVLVYKPLGHEELSLIIKKEFKLLKDRIYNKIKVNLALHNSALKKLTEKGFVPEYGARYIKRLIKNEIENLIADKILNGTLNKQKKRLWIKSKKDTFVIE